MRRTPLDDIRVHVRFKLSALWASVMLCYLYGDFFGLYKPGTVKEMLAGQLGGDDVSQGMLVAMAAIMAVPSAMVFLSLALPAAACRRANIVLGIAYTLLMAVSMVGMWAYYLLLGVIEMAMTLAIVAYAWRWPRQAEAA